MPPDYSAPTCRKTGKVCYSTRSAASRAMREIMSMERDMVKRRRMKIGSKRPLNAYLCSMCNHWHVGHSPSKQLRSRRLYPVDDD